MAFLIDETVIHIKLTDKGRELLSRGELTFKKFAIGDSEIDYGYNSDNDLAAENDVVLRPFDNNPDIASFITENVDGDLYTSLPSIANTTSTISNTIDQKGMFDVESSTKTLFSDPAHVKQANVQIVTSSVHGGQQLTLNQTGSYVAGSPEPVVGDYLMIKWANPYVNATTVGFDVDKAIPYLFYKIVSVDSGSISSNSLQVTVDRDLPNFENVTTPYNSGVMIYPNNNGRKISGDSIQNYYGAPFVTDFVSESMISFFENYDTPTIDVPIWNMTIVFTEDIAGINPSSYRDISGNPSVEFGGMVQYFQRLDPKVKNIGLIHYTNLSPSNNYGEGLVANATSVPILDLPTIMWHKNSNASIGLRLIGDQNSIDSLPDLNTTYLNLIDDNDNILGKVFPDLKIFIIEDQELLMAMSYKSNRNWTLPPVNVDLNASLCPASDVEIIIESVTP